ncbi:MAG: TIGR04076 family protein [Bacteroidales bacterium]|nr:TIGR04076 family protein [Bacteroidales bacterium]
MRVRITAVKQILHSDLAAKYENPLDHGCDLTVGQVWISENGECPEGMCHAAWDSMRPFVESLARGEGNFYDGWMKDPMTAMISCSDGFRPMSFYLEVV